MSAQRLVAHLLEADPDDIDPRAYLDALPRQNWTYHVEFENIDNPEGEWVVYFELDRVGYGMLAQSITSEEEANSKGAKWTKRFNDLQRKHPFPRETKSLSVWSWYDIFRQHP